MLWYDPNKQSYGRAHHGRVADGYFMLHLDKNPVPGTLILKGEINNIQDQNEITLDNVNTPFDNSLQFSYNVTIPAHGPLLAEWEDDSTFGLPVIKEMKPNSVFCTGCQCKFWRQSWLLSLHQDEPITVARTMDYIEYLRDQKIFTFQVTLYPRQTMNNTRYEEFRTYFDNIRPAVSHSIFPSSAYAIQTPVNQQHHFTSDNSTQISSENNGTVQFLKDMIKIIKSG